MSAFDILPYGLLVFFLSLLLKKPAIKIRPTFRGFFLTLEMLIMLPAFAFLTFFLVTLIHKAKITSEQNSQLWKQVILLQIRCNERFYGNSSQDSLVEEAINKMSINGSMLTYKKVNNIFVVTLPNKITISLSKKDLDFFPENTDLSMGDKIN